ncbi:RHS repeat-associated core domain-containing protein, partial [Lysobacter sp. CCNWLW3]
RYDAATGLNYNYFRDYDAGSGRYVQSDPIGLNAGISTYAYVNGRPLHYVDPHGLEVISIYVDGTLERMGRRDAKDIRETYERARGIRDWANERYPRVRGDPNDAMRHCVTSCMMAREKTLGSNAGRVLGVVNEGWGFVRHDLMLLVPKIRDGGPWAFQMSDLEHNEKGFCTGNSLPGDRPMKAPIEQLGQECARACSK